jgi:hypothetical protein
MSGPGVKRQSSPAAIGGVCVLAAIFLPLASSLFFFFFSLPLLIAAFVLSIVSLARGRALGGVILMVAVFFAGPASFVATMAGHVGRKTYSEVRARAEEKAPQPELTPSSAPLLPPGMVRLVQPISIGGETVPAGTAIRLVGRIDEETLRVRYQGADYDIPISAVAWQ